MFGEFPWPAIVTVATGVKFFQLALTPEDTTASIERDLEKKERKRLEAQKKDGTKDQRTSLEQGSMPDDDGNQRPEQFLDEPGVDLCDAHLLGQSHDAEGQPSLTEACPSPNSLMASPPVTPARAPWSSGPGSPRPRPASPARVPVPASRCAGRCRRTVGFTSMVRSGDIRTGPTRDHTIKVDVTGLKADTTYYYRFVFGSYRSAVGRTRTAPAATASPTNVRFGVVSCANFQAGWFSAYRHLANRNDLHRDPAPRRLHLRVRSRRVRLRPGRRRHPHARARPRDR